jgi:hypothetical protein
MNINIVLFDTLLAHGFDIEKLDINNNLNLESTYNIIKSSVNKSFLHKCINFYEHVLYSRGTKFINKFNNKDSDFCLNLTDKVNDFNNGISNIRLNAYSFSDELLWFKDIIVNKLDSITVTYIYKTGGRELYYSFIIRPDYLFIYKTRHEILSKLLSVIVDAKPLGELLAEQNDKFVLSSISFFNLFCQLISNLFSKIINKLFFKLQWQIQYKLDSTNKDWITLVPPNDRFWADPFLLEDSGKYFLFVEELIYKKGFAHLSVLEVNKEGILTDSRIILDKGHHLSYPYVFIHEEVYYMIPETEKSRTIELYVSENFPYDWKFKKNLLEDIYASDTSVVKHNGLWWLFTSEKSLRTDGYDSYLSIYYSDNLLGGHWTPVKNNPVKVDVRDSRCGGYIYEKKGILYRVSQNCSRSYGFGYNILRILKLSENEFEEAICQKLIADDLRKDILATHTYSVNNNLVVRDILKRIKK